jgi:hypothetical protein
MVLTFRDGDTVIVSHPEKTHQVGSVISSRIVSKRRVYDVLLESRSVLLLLTQSSKDNYYINSDLTKTLCHTYKVTSNITSFDRENLIDVIKG